MKALALALLFFTLCILAQTSLPLALFFGMVSAIVLRDRRP